MIKNLFPEITKQMISDNKIPELELPPRPQEPLPEECCGRGCERCVYVYYEEALQRWEEKVAELKQQSLSGLDKT